LLLEVLEGDHFIPEACHQLALLYEYGRGAPQNFQKAAEYYRRAAEQNYIESMYNLALMYAYGRGVSKNYPRAISLFEHASRENHAPSVYYMGIMKTYGYGTSIDYDQAINWFERAAGLDDIRVSAKARLASIELSQAKQEADLRNEERLDRYIKMSEVR